MPVSAKLVKLADKIDDLNDLLTDPPKGWSEGRIRGYFVWSYAVCKNLFGLSEWLDKKATQLFEKVGINGMDDSDLEVQLKQYYDLLSNE